MNHLAHTLLAGPDPGHRLGAFLGDHVKGRAALADWPEDVADGIVLHRRIDAWSDRHAAVRALLARTPPRWRRYAPVVYDVLFDAMLVRHWDAFCDRPLGAFGAESDALLAVHRRDLPERLNRFAAWARVRRLWLRLDDPALLAEIFARLAARHARPSPLADGLELLDTMEAAIERAFLELFPDLTAAARGFRSGLA